jgi:transcriptional regulator with XRE-family HTH domain
MGLHIGNFYGPATFDCMEKVGERIRRMRKAQGLSQVDLAAKMGVDQSTISDIERGAGFSAELLMKMCDHLGGSAALIMRGEDAAVWPFPKVEIERFLALEPEDRSFVQGKLLAAIEQVEGPSPADVQLFSKAHAARKKAPAPKGRRAA